MKFLINGKFKFEGILASIFGLTTFLWLVTLDRLNFLTSLFEGLPYWIYFTMCYFVILWGQGLL